MNRQNRNVKVIAKGSRRKGWFDIYIDFSGKQEYLMSHRWNGYLFCLLKAGRSIEEIERNMQKFVSSVSLSGYRHIRGRNNPQLKRRKNQSRKLENSVEHLLAVVNEYICEDEYKVPEYAA